MARKPSSDLTSPPLGEAMNPPDFVGRHGDGVIVQCLMEIQHDLGRLTEKVDSLSGKLDKASTKVDTLYDKYTFFRGAVWVIGSMVGLLVLLVSTGLGEKARNLFLTSTPATVTAPASAVK